MQSTPITQTLPQLTLQELAAATAYTASGQLIQRSSPELRPGDYVKLRLSHFNTPYGDAQLDPVGIPSDVRSKLVWDELETRMRKGQMVQGRVLNVTSRGYAVGVAGYVALLESNHALPETAAQIGTLQPFYVHSMDRARKQIKLSGVKQESDMEEMYRRSM
jgi:ribosomal protein S1